MNSLKVVGRKGVEPLSTGSEPVVLTITPPTEILRLSQAAGQKKCNINFSKMFNP